MTNKSTFNNCLVIRFVIVNFYWFVRRNSLLCLFTSNCQVILFLCCRNTSSFLSYFFKLLHHFNTLHKTAVSETLIGIVNFIYSDFHFLKMRSDELIYNLRRQVYPNVEDSVLIYIFKWILQINLCPLYNFFGPLEVLHVPLIIRLILVLLAISAVRQQVIKKLNRQHINVF